MYKIGVFDIKFIDTMYQWADILTKLLAKDRFVFIHNNLGMHKVDA